MHKLFEQQVALNSETISVVDQQGEYSYRQLELRANQLANLLQQQGIGAGELIGVCLDRHFEMVATLLAIMKIGASYLPLDPTYPAERLNYMAQDAKLRYLFCEDSFRSLFVESKVQFIDTTSKQVLESFNSYSDDCRLYVIYTSGSTGKPKGVELFHHNLEPLFTWMPKATRITECQRTLQFSPLSFDPSFMEIFSTLTQGKTLVLVDGNLRKDPEFLLDYIIKQRIERLFVPIIMLHALAGEALDQQRFPLQLKEINCGGDAMKVNRDVVEFCRQIPGVELNNQYGPTEAAIMVTHHNLKGDPYRWPKQPPLGGAIDGVTLKIFDAQMNLANYGELYIGGKCVAIGYMERDQLTKERFIELDGQRFYKTGDLVRLDETGNLFFVGRIDEQVKINGIRIELGEVEQLISSIDQVKESVAVVKDDRGIKRFIAYYVGDISEDEVKAVLTKRLPANMLPHFIIKLDKFPLSATGKIDRKALALPQRIQRQEEAHLAPDQQQLKELWEEVLKVDGISLTDNFFDVGGNSLLAMKLISKIRKQLKVKLSVMQFFQYPTIEKLAQSFVQSKQYKNVARSTMSGRKEVAVVGLACRFPGAQNIDEFWKMIVNNEEGITFFNDDELDPSVSESLKQNRNYIKARGIISGIDQFDPAFWGLSPLVAQVMDPQLRLILEYAHRALEHSGNYSKQFDAKIGVFAGMSNNTYFPNNVRGYPEKIARVGEWTVATLNEKDYVATQIAYRLGLTGPALSVHSACSTSLVAIVEAIKAIEQGECVAAVAGGVNIDAISKQGYLYQEGSIRSQDGHCRPFDKESSGTIFCDGVGMVVLKELEQAKQDGDQIFAVVRGTGINNDGNDKMSFTAPSINGQRDVIEMALNDRGVNAQDIGLVEAHGTATPVGDPIEVEALRQAWHTDKKQYAVLSSVKGNVGHMIGAAGVSGFIKSVLALHHKTLPPTNHFNSANPMLNLDESPFRVLQTAQEWKADKYLAAVSSFGVGGTNAHIILERASQNQIEGTVNFPRVPVLLTAKSSTALKNYHQQLKGFLQSNSQLNLLDIAYTLTMGRERYNYQSCYLVSDVHELIQQLDICEINQNSKRETIWAFSGQGSQYLGMGKVLYDNFAVFKQSCDYCFSILKPLLKRDLKEVMFFDHSDEALKNTYYTQPAIFVIQYSLVQLVQKLFNLTPDIVLGHSIGELCAAVVAKVLSVEDALRIIAKRSNLMSSIEYGDMLSVRLPLDEVQKYINDQVQVAAVNGPRLTVLAGPGTAIDHVVKQLEQDGVASKKLHTSHAFHSSMMEEMVPTFLQFLESFTFNKPQIAFYSTVTNCFVDSELTQASYWAQHVVKGVLFAPAIEELMQRGDYNFLEFGPRGTLSTLMQQQNRESKRKWQKANLLQSSPAEELKAFFRGAGVLLSWNNQLLDKMQLRGNKVTLPTYCYDYKSIWLEPKSMPVRVTDFKQEIPLQQTRTITRTKIVKEANQVIREKIINLLAESSGVSSSEISADESFMELGFDSLSLTQVAQDLSKEFQVEIGFRKLMGELQTADSLSEFIIANIPASVRNELAVTEEVQENVVTNDAVDAVESEPVSYTTIANSPIRSSAVKGEMQDLFSQQLEIMRQQIALLQGGVSVASSPTPAAEPQVTTEGEVKVTTEKRATKEASKAKIKVEVEEVKATVNTHKIAFGAQARIKIDKEEDQEMIKKNIEDFMQQYLAKTKKSKEFTQRYRAANADPRVVTGFRPEIKEMIYPLVVNRSKAQHLWDIDGNEYVDMICGFGSNFFGNQNPRITKALHDQLDRGFEIGPQHELVGECAELICKFTKLERAAFCNTGSEAVLGAIRAARTITGKTKVVMFKGSYHGINDEVIVRGPGSGVAMPAAAGISRNATQDILLLDYGTDEALEIIRENINSLAAVITESVQSRRTDFRPKKFLQELRKITAEYGVALIFDEVITGFRILPGGAQEYYGIQADLATYGKIIGAGMPVGVIAGKQKFMDALDGGYWQYGDESYPSVGVTYFAGTFVRHPLTLRAMREALYILQEAGREFYEKLNQTADQFVERLNLFAQQESAPIIFDHFGGVLKPRSLSHDKNSDLLFALMRFNGVHVYDGFPWFVTMAHTQEDLAFVEQCFKKSIKMMQQMGIFPSNSKAQQEGKILTTDSDGNPVWQDVDGNITPYKEGE